MYKGKSDRHEKSEQTRKLRAVVQSWLFALLTTFSRLQFTHMLKRMKTDSNLQDFGKRLQYQKNVVKELRGLLTDKQFPLCCKPFFHSISYYNDQGRAYVQMPVSATEFDSREVTDIIKDVKEWNTYANFVSEVLHDSEEMSEQTKKTIRNEQQIALAAKASQQQYFDDLKLQEETKLRKREEKQREKEEKIMNPQSVADIMGIKLEEGKKAIDQEQISQDSNSSSSSDDDDLALDTGSEPDLVDLMLANKILHKDIEMEPADFQDYYKNKIKSDEKKVLLKKAKRIGKKRRSTEQQMMLRKHHDEQQKIKQRQKLGKTHIQGRLLHN